MYSITWLDPRTDPADEPAWAVWETECGTYRITWDAKTDRYTPCVYECVMLAHSARHFQQRKIGAACPTLETAQDIINLYHCEQNNLMPA